MKQKIIVKKTTRNTEVKKQSVFHHKVKITKKQIDFFKIEVKEYYDSSGYLSWSSSKKKYIILGTNTARDGLVECPQCHLGKLRIIRSQKTRKRFMGCSNYYNGCTASSPLLQKASMRSTKIPCNNCGWPIILFRYSRKQKWVRRCANFVCKATLKIKS